MRTSLVIVAGLLAVLAYYLYTPVPDAIEEKLKFRVFATIPKIMEFVGSIMGLFNGKNSIQNFHELVVSLAPRPPSTVEGSNIVSEVVTFDGVRVLLYKPVQRKSDGPVAGLMFFHGGGFMLGSPEMYDDITRAIAEELDIVVASVDYRLSTEKPFPASHEDCWDALQHFLAHAAEYGVDPARVGVAGDSAGGNLAAGVAQRAAADPALPRLRLQALIYPLLQLLDYHTPSYQRHRAEFGPRGGVLPWGMDGTFRSFLLLGRRDPALVEALLANNHTSRAFKAAHPDWFDHALVPESLRRHPSYRGPKVDEGDDRLWASLRPLLLDPRLLPLWAEAEDLARLPPAYVVSCQYDSLRDDAVMYAARLEKAGVPVKLINYHNGWHGMMSGKVFHITRRSIRHLIAYLKENL